MNIFLFNHYSFAKFSLRIKLFVKNFFKLADINLAYYLRSCKVFRYLLTM